ncbi:MAG: hypothetical protein ISQ07_06890 [Pirellulales bacterium]|jgi:membrane protease subunit HflK|nr:hypothetical protein [Pirellulales bacterium]
MTDDQITFRRGSIAAIAGLVIQIALTVAMGLLGLWTESPAVQAATWHMLGGLPIWVLLVLLYNQYGIEKRESLASEQLATQDAASAALFGEQSDELQRARARLANLLTWGLSGVSFLVSVFLIFAGVALIWRFIVLMRDESPTAVTTLAEGINPIGLLFVSAAIAFVAFVSGRWISGYTRVKAWQLLRGGASYLMSCFVLATVILAGSIVAAVVDDTAFFHFVAAAVPILMILVGTEILLTQLFSAYRPRRPGEIPRPAFDSRFLGLLTQPEALGQIVGELIQYQFGVEVSRSWLYLLLGRAITPLLVFGGSILLALSTVVIVGPDEQGLVLRFGQLRPPARPPGIHFKLPWPFETSVTFPIGKVQQVTVSSDPAGRWQNAAAFLWTGSDDRLSTVGMEYFPTGLATSENGADIGLIHADVVVQYQIRDLVDFQRAAVDPDDAIRLVSSQEAGRFFASHDLDWLLTHGRTEGGPGLHQAIQERLDRFGLGLHVVSVAITSLMPPGGNVARAFHSQIGAQQERQTLIEQGHRDAVTTLASVAGSVDRSRRISAAILELDTLRRDVADDTTPASTNQRRLQIANRELDIETLLGEARGEAAELIYNARGYRWKRAVGESSSLEQFSGELLAHESAPLYYRTRRFLDVLSESLSDRRKYIITGTTTTPTLKLDLNDSASALDTLLSD